MSRVLRGAVSACRRMCVPGVQAQRLGQLIVVNCPSRRHLCSASLGELQRHGGGPLFGHSLASRASSSLASDQPMASTSGSPPPASGEGADLWTKLDIRVGLITSCKKHPDAESLFVESVDLGLDSGPRTIVSGLVGYVPLEDLQGRMVLVLANLKPRTMRGVLSSGMLLCAVSSDRSKVEPLAPAQGSHPGDRAAFCSFEEEDQAGNEARVAAAAELTPATPNQLQKKKWWEAVQPCLFVDHRGQVKCKRHTLQTRAGVVYAPTLRNVSVS